MKPHVHGIISLGLISAAVTIAAVALFNFSIPLGVCYLIGCSASTAAILAAFCAKCPSRDNCGHLLPGKIVRHFKTRSEGLYTGYELMITALALLFLLGLPQIWLWHTAMLFISFWVLLIISLGQIAGKVCNHCDNRYCPSKRFF